LQLQGIWRFAFQPEIDLLGRGQNNWHRLGMAARTGQPFILRTNHKAKIRAQAIEIIERVLMHDVDDAARN
jgi:hypothetical protein